MAAGKKPFDKPDIGERFNPYGLFNGIYIPEQIAGYWGLTPGAKLAYGVIGRIKGENRDCFIGVPRLGNEIGCCGNQARTYLHELRDKCFIEIEERPGTSSLYHFLWHAAYEGQKGEKRKPGPLQKTGGVDTSILGPSTPPVNVRGTPPVNGTTPLQKTGVDPSSKLETNTVTEYSHLKQSIENTEAGALSAPVSASLSSLNSVLTSTASGLHDDEPQKARSDVRLTVAAAKANSKSKTPKAETAAKTAAGSHEKPSHEKERLLTVWTNAELAAVRQAVTEYMEGDFEPPLGFEQSCELRARGATAAEVCELLERKYAVKRYHLYHKYGPGGTEGDASMWNWFLTVIGNDLDHPHIPEPTAARASTELSRGKFKEMTSALEGGEELS